MTVASWLVIADVPLKPCAVAGGQNQHIHLKISNPFSLFLSFERLFPTANQSAPKSLVLQKSLREISLVKMQLSTRIVFSLWTFLLRKPWAETGPALDLFFIQTEKNNTFFKFDFAKQHICSFNCFGHLLLHKTLFIRL